MTGHDDFDDEPEEFRPVPHPDDRLWRHPSEIAAMHAAHANAETAQVPVVAVPDTAGRSRVHTGVMIAAGIAVVGAAALTFGVLSARPSGSQVATTNATPRTVTLDATDTIDADAPADTGLQEPSASTELAVEVSSQGEDLLTTRVHNEVAASLPRITAVNSAGMSEGSGMFVTDNGHIVTSASLIDGAEYVLAWTDDGQRWKAHLIASDPISDVAVIQIDSAAWPPVSLDGGADLWDGQYALALDHAADSIRIGEVTGVNAPDLEVAQPAALPGSAIVDDTGTVIAMITGDGTNSRGTRSWLLEQVAVDLIASGHTSHNWLGLVVDAEATGDMVVVVSVIDGSPAAQAGLQAGDLIDSFNGDLVLDAASLHRQVQNADAGEAAVLTVTSDGDRRIVVAVIAELAP